MAHARKQIRDAVVDALDGIAAVDGRVYPYRTVPHQAMPDITVHTDSEEVDHEQDTLDGKEVRIVTVTVEIRDKATDTLDDDIDALCASVEAAMMTDPTLGGTVKRLELVTTEIEMQGESEQATGMASLEYAAWYRAMRGAPETIIS